MSMPNEDVCPCCGRRKSGREATFAGSDGWETVAATFASEIREARRARRIALRGGKAYIETIQYWETYMAALMRFRTILKAKMKPSPNGKISDRSAL